MPVLPTAETAPASADPRAESLFDFLPIGAYRSLPNGRQVRANPALVRLNGYDTEAEMLAAVHDIAAEWYVDPNRRAEFRKRLERDGRVLAFVSEIYRHKTRERLWISEDAHLVRNADGSIAFYEGTVEDVTDRVRVQAALERSEEQLRQITARVPGVVFRTVISPTGPRRFTFLSAGLRALFGVDPADVMADGTRLQAMRHPEDRARAAAVIGAAQRAHEPVETDFRIVLPDGSIKWVHLASSPAPDEDGCTVRIGVMIDITARQRAEQALRESEARWKLALEGSGDGVWDWDLRSGACALSRRCLELYGFEPGELEERADALDTLVHPDDLAPMLRDRQAHLDAHTPAFVNESRMHCKDGSWKWTLMRGMVIARGPGNEPLRMIGTHTDITQRKQADALRRERDQAESAQRTTNHFLSRVSHELRTPLNAILGFAQLLQMEPVAGVRQRGWIAEVLASGRHLLGLVDDVLDLSSAQSGLLPVERVAVDLRLAVAESWAMLAADAAREGIGFDNLLADAAPLIVQADRKRLKQILSNLLSNAIKYNRPGGRITLAVTHEADRIEIAISDTGAGMDEAQLARLFTPFERLGAKNTAVAGTGLGLALSRQLVEAMGGTIGVDSTPGVGTTFRVRLPDGSTPPELHATS